MSKTAVIAMIYHPRILSTESNGDLALEIELIGAAPEGVYRMLPKTRSYALKLSDVSAPHAHILKETFLSVGGDAAMSRGLMNGNTDRSDVILMGTRKHFNSAISALTGETIGGPQLAREIESAITAFEAGPIIPDDSAVSDPKVRWMYGELKKRTLVMGILNVTPDSFSDGGQFVDRGDIVQYALKMVENGADIIDIGGESTRPGSEPVSVEEEIKRVVPIIEEVASQTDRPISVDTYKAETAKAALDAGASIINDISGMAFDPAMKGLAAKKGCPVILMHIKGKPQDMQTRAVYKDLMGEVTEYLRQRIMDAIDAGIDERLLIIDPGFGFAKTAEHNLEILRRLGELKVLGRPILIGPSRKATIGQALGGLPPKERVEGTAAAVAISIANGANIVRVHDIKEMAQVARMTDAIVKPSG